MHSLILGSLISSIISESCYHLLDICGYNIIDLYRTYIDLTSETKHFESLDFINIHKQDQRLIQNNN